MIDKFPTTCRVGNHALIGLSGVEEQLRSLYGARSILVEPTAPTARAAPAARAVSAPRTNAHKPTAVSG
jgi:hypothetical protein